MSLTAVTVWALFCLRPSVSCLDYWPSGFRLLLGSSVRQPRVLVFIADAAAGEGRSSAGRSRGAAEGAHRCPQGCSLSSPEARSNVKNSFKFNDCIYYMKESLPSVNEKIILIICQELWMMCFVVTVFKAGSCCVSRLALSSWWPSASAPECCGHRGCQHTWRVDGVWVYRSLIIGESCPLMILLQDIVSITSTTEWIPAFSAWLDLPLWPYLALASQPHVSYRR